MKSTLIVSTFAVAATLFITQNPVQAQEALPSLPTASTSAKTASAVQIELAAANAAGFLRFSEATQIAAAVYANAVAATRTQIAAEALEAQRQGLTSTGEVSVVATEKQLAAILEAGRNAVRFASALAVSAK
jgi:hypothetical protein